MLFLWSQSDVQNRLQAFELEPLVIRSFIEVVCGGLQSQLQFSVGAVEKDFVWSLKTEASSGAVVEQVLNRSYLMMCDSPHGSSFGIELSDQAVGILFYRVGADSKHTGVCGVNIGNA